MTNDNKQLIDALKQIIEATEAATTGEKMYSFTPEQLQTLLNRVHSIAVDEMIEIVRGTDFTNSADTIASLSIEDNHIQVELDEEFIAEAISDEISDGWQEAKYDVADVEDFVELVMLHEEASASKKKRK